jgi:hypothetical protein
MRDWSSGLADVAGPSEKESVKTNLEASSLFVTGSQVAAFRSSCLELLRGGNGDAPLPENIGALIGRYVKRGTVTDMSRVLVSTLEGSLGEASV